MIQVAAPHQTFINSAPDLTSHLLSMLNEFVYQLVCSGQLTMAKSLRIKILEKVLADSLSHRKLFIKLIFRLVYRFPDWSVKETEIAIVECVSPIACHYDRFTNVNRLEVGRYCWANDVTRCGIICKNWDTRSVDLGAGTVRRAVTEFNTIYGTF